MSRSDAPLLGKVLTLGAIEPKTEVIAGLADAKLRYLNLQLRTVVNPHANIISPR